MCERLEAGFVGQSDQWNLEKSDLKIRLKFKELAKWVDMECAAGQKGKLAKISILYLLLVTKLKNRCLKDAFLI